MRAQSLLRVREEQQESPTRNSAWMSRPAGVRRPRVRDLDRVEDLFRERDESRHVLKIANGFRERPRPVIISPRE